MNVLQFQRKKKLREKTNFDVAKIFYKKLAIKQY